MAQVTPVGGAAVVGPGTSGSVTNFTASGVKGLDAGKQAGTITKSLASAPSSSGSKQSQPATPATVNQIRSGRRSNDDDELIALLTQLLEQRG
jgi:hypothetical protein